MEIDPRTGGVLRLTDKASGLSPIDPGTDNSLLEYAVERPHGMTSWLIDHTGRRYLDAVNNITHAGHCHPHVVAAIARQAGILNTNTRYLSELILDYSERLTAKLPGDLKVAYFVNSGTEANELALRIARTAIGKKSTVVLDCEFSLLKS